MRTAHSRATFRAQLQLTGPGAAGATNQGWGVMRTGYAVGNTDQSRSRSLSSTRRMCTNSAVVTNVNGGAVNIPLGAGYAMTLSQAGQHSDDHEHSYLRQPTHADQEVNGGTASPASWTLNASFLASASVPTGLPGFAGASGAAAVTNQLVTPNARYQLFENGGDPRYVQTDNRTNLQSNPLSTGSATCIRVDAQGAPWPNDGFSDGINGGVNVPLGYRVACTIVNQTASLTLLKNVVNDNGGSDRGQRMAADGDARAAHGPHGDDRRRFGGGRPGEHLPGTPEPRLHAHRIERAGLRVRQAPAADRRRLGGCAGQSQSGRLSAAGRRGQLADQGRRARHPPVPLRQRRCRPHPHARQDRDQRRGRHRSAVRWTLTATAPGGPNLTGTTGTAGVTAQPVRAGVVYTIGETGPAAYIWNTLSCTGYPNTTQAAPTITLSPGDNVTCTLNNNDILVPVTVAKADGAVQQLADGTWSISYEVVVTNGSPTLPTTYSLTDTPEFDSSFTILSQGWQGDPDVTDIAIEGGGTDTYTYVVTAESNETPVDPTALVCSPTDGGGFFNAATVTFPGGTDSDTGCAVPAKPGVAKTALPAVQDAATGAWTLSYEVVVSNSTTIPLAYTLTDTAAALPAGVTGGTWAASDPVPVGGGTFVRDTAWAGSGQIATGTLPAGATHTYTVSRTVIVAASVTDDALTCGSVVNQGGGVWNTATVTNGIANDDSSDCAEIDRPTVDITKTVSSTAQREDGTWEITYEVSVIHNGGPFRGLQPHGRAHVRRRHHGRRCLLDRPGGQRPLRRRWNGDARHRPHPPHRRRGHLHGDGARDGRRGRLVGRHARHAQAGRFPPPADS